MKIPKRCLKYDSSRNFYYQIDNIIMPDRNFKGKKSWPVKVSSGLMFILLVLLSMQLNFY